MSYFDKTGTLTFGKPKLLQVLPFGKLDPHSCLRLAASLEQASEHPLAQSFLERIGKNELHSVTEAQNFPGKGVAGLINGHRYTLGNRMLSALDSGAAGARPGCRGWRNRGMALRRTARCLLPSRLSDELRPDAIGL